LWVIIVSVLLCALVAVLFFTAPMDEESAPNTPSEEQTSSEASTELSIEESTESSTEESSGAEPSEPEESQPEESQPDESEPEASEPEVSEPEVSEPEISEPEVSEPPEEPVIPPTLELPPEGELKAELQLRFDIGPGHTVQYGGEYYEFPEYATPMLYYGIVADGKGNFYLEKSKTLIRINDSKEFPYQFSESFAQVIFLEDDLYVHTVDGYVRRFDISAGFENGTLTGEWKRYERFNGDGSIRLVDGRILFRDEQGQYSTLDGDLVESKEPYTFVPSAEQVVTKLEDGTFAVHDSYDKRRHYIHCLGGEGLTIVHSADTFWTDTHSVSQTEYFLFDRNGELCSRLMLRREAGYQYRPCKIECNNCTIEYYHPKTLYFNGMVFEDVIFDTVLYGEDGTFYLMVLHPHYGEIYAITGGVAHEEFLSSEGWMDDIDDLPILVSIDMMKRDALLEFLADPRTYSFRGGWDIPVNGIPGYPTLNYETFYLKPDLLEIATDHSAMEAFLKKRGITCDVTEIHLFEAAITPFTLFVKTGDGTLYFIGVEYSEDVYTYTLYTEEEYLAAYYPYPLTIMVDGKKLETDDPFVIYGEYAELPLVAIMEALGAKLEWKYDDYVGITWGGNQCWIDTDYSSLKYGEQRFHAVMDRYSLYKGNDVTFRSDTLQEFFKAFCHGVTVRVDAEESVVYIDNQYADTIECYFSPDGKSVLYAVLNEDEAYDWYRIVGDGEPEALPIDIQPYRDSMKRWANDFSVVYFTNINQSTFLSCLYKWDENGEVSLLSETCYADALSVLYEDGSFYFQERTTVSYDTFIENDLGEAGEEPMAWVSRMRARLATVYYYDGHEKKLAAENVWCDATGWDPYAAEASGGAYLTLDPGEKVKLSAILEIVGENRNVGWLDKAMRAFAKCIYTVKDQYYTVDLDRASVAIIAKDAKHLAVLSDWDPHTEFGTLYLVKIGEQGVEEVTLISEKITSKEPMRMNAYFSGSNYLVYRADGADRDTYVQIGDQS
ncbi:MAG: hypothetical protein IKK06_08205, partial [Clostridia bacterium]|nr:hypothetical protein [Clostridia bacterium]